MTEKVEEFLQGLRAGEPRAVDAVHRLLGTMARKHEPTELSPRQVQALELVAQGLSDTEIGILWGVETETVKKHVLSAKYRLGARTRPQMIVLWLAQEAKKPG